MLEIHCQVWQNKQTKTNTHTKKTPEILIGIVLSDGERFGVGGRTHNFKTLNLLIHKYGMFLHLLNCSYVP